MSSSEDQAALRSDRVRSGFAAGLLSRAVKFAVNLVITRLIVREMGGDGWGLVALAGAMVDLVLLADLAVYELTGYEVAAAEDRQAAQRSLDQAWLLSLVPAALGTLVLLGLSIAAGLGLTTATQAYGPLVQQLLLAAASTYAFSVVGNVYAGVLLGYGWIRELNYIGIAGFLFDLIVVFLGVRQGLGLAEVQWLRAAGPLLRLALLYLTLRVRRLPTPRLVAPDPARLRRLLRFAVGYNVSKGLGGLEYACDIPIAQLFVAPASLGAYAVADQWANKPYRFSHAIFESLYHRLARAFRSGATEQERVDGASQFLGATMLITTVVAPVAAGLALAGPWLFRLWLGEDQPLATLLLPWLAAAWTLNAIASPSTCLILATGSFPASVRAHLLAVAVNVVGDVALGWHYGMRGIVVATLVANLLLTGMLSRAACSLARTSWPRYIAWNAVPLGVAALCVGIAGASDASSTPGITVLATAAAATGAAVTAWRSPHLSAMLMAIRRR